MREKQLQGLFSCLLVEFDNYHCVWSKPQINCFFLLTFPQVYAFYGFQFQKPNLRERLLAVGREKNQRENEFREKPQRDKVWREKERTWPRVERVPRGWGRRDFVRKLNGNKDRTTLIYYFFLGSHLELQYNSYLVLILASLFTSRTLIWDSQLLIKAFLLICGMLPIGYLSCGPQLVPLPQMECHQPSIGTFQPNDLLTNQSWSLVVQLKWVPIGSHQI